MVPPVLSSPLRRTGGPAIHSFSGSPALYKVKAAREAETPALRRSLRSSASLEQARHALGVMNDTGGKNLKGAARQRRCAGAIALKSGDFAAAKHYLR